jgi:hypothetical protein
MLSFRGFNPSAKRCSRCKSVLNTSEQEHRWCDKCRSNKRKENSNNKENRESRDNAAALFGYDRNKNRQSNKDIRKNAMSLFMPPRKDNDD